MAGTSLAAHTRRLVVVLGIAVIVVVALVLHGWPGSRPVSAAGNSISSPDPGVNVGAYSSLKLDSSGNPVVGYFDLYNFDLKVLHCGNPTCTSGNVIVTPDSTGNVGEAISLALDASGNPVISYFDDLPNYDLKILHCGNATCTAGNSIVSPDTIGTVGSVTSLAIDAAGNPVVAYFNLTGGNLTGGGLRLLHCGDPNCASGNTIEAPDPTAPYTYFISLRLDSAGYPVVSYSDTLGLRVLHCGDAMCSSGSVIAMPDPGLVLGAWFSALMLDTIGNPVVSYYDMLNDDLKVLHCGDPNCSSGNTITLPDTAGDVGAFLSLELDIVGNPVVSYFNYDNYELRLLHCGDPTCSSGNVIAVPDPDVGLETSLQLDSLGNPVVSYFDNANGKLRVLHCGDPNCVSANKPTATAISTASPTVTTATATRTPTPCPTGKAPLPFASGCGTPTSTDTATRTPTHTPRPQPLGGVADYPNVSGGSSAWRYALLATASALLALASAARYARRRSSI